MTYEYTGTLKWVGQVINCTGKIKRKINIVIEEKDKSLYMVIFDDNIEKFLEPLELGDKVTGSFSVKSTEYNGKWTTNIYCLTMSKVERRKRQEQYQKWQYTDPRKTVYSHFTGCTTPEQIKKRYRELCKKYHPDTGNGNEKLMSEVNVQYNKIK